MAIIYSYPRRTPLASDIMLAAEISAPGEDPPVVKSFTVGQLIELIEGGGGVYAPLDSPQFTGTPYLPIGTTGVTRAISNNSTSLATTAFVQSVVAATAPGQQNLFQVTTRGNVTTTPIEANSFVKTGGVGLNVLLDDGNTRSTNSILGTTNLSPTQTVSSFTINSDTGTDATIPLGDGINAGATLNNYTTAEQTKLGKYPSTATNGKILQGNGTIYVEIDTPTGTTNLNYTPSAINGIITSSTGEDATIPLADGTNAGLFTAAEKTKLAAITGTNTGDQNLQTVTNGVGNNTTTNSITAESFVKDGGFDNQFLKADGSVDNNTYLTSADLPSTLDLYATTSPDPVIAGYTALVRNITDPRYNTTAVNVPTPTITGTVLAPTFCGAVISDPSVLLGNPGVFNFSVIGKIRRSGGSTASGADFFYSIYKRDISGVETLIANSAPVAVPANGGVYIEYISIALWNNGTFLSTDRVVLKFYGIKSGEGSGATYEFLFGGTDPVRGTAAISSAIIPNLYLRDLADVEKTDALNNEVLYWNDPASLWEHSLVVDLTPDASATQKGLVTTGVQAFAGAKTFSSISIPSFGTGELVAANTGGLLGSLSIDDGYPSVSEIAYVTGVTSSIQTQLNAKQATLVSATNIKTINGTTILGSGDLVVSGGGSITLSAIGSSSNANGATITGSVLNLQPANASFGGVVTTGTQTFAGAKTFSNLASFGTIYSTAFGPSQLVGTYTDSTLMGLFTDDGYPSLDEIKYVTGVTSNIQTQLNTAQTQSNTATEFVLTRGNAALGSSIKGVNLSFPFINNISSGATMSTGRCEWHAYFLPTAKTITGVKWWQSVAGVYTAANYCGVGLYSATPIGNMTLVASSTNDGNIWKQASNTLGTKAFSGTYNAAAGLYYIAILWGSSATPTTPQIGVSTTPSSSTGAFDFTNSAKLLGAAFGKAALPTPTQNMAETTLLQINRAIFLY